MQKAQISNYKQQCSKTDLAFFYLLKSLAELYECKNSLSQVEIEQLKVGARVLNGLIAKNDNKPVQLAS
ncbi:hypothetical protein [Legionella worsleiensis]|uniref:Uncharacterized protein n=1 Tax=Legionella worsleiensis TaxID=45076 RepID=A0A0W1AG89_9GAMM|nr:hypothetical protein [Legionella worsleiensis]KTD80367.1 hypothetical protein Lwor_1038 [Legionella worsleiensis]STY32771.1 Uncharacterised protein [Legionella worsleiensis]